MARNKNQEEQVIETTPEEVAAEPVKSEAKTTSVEVDLKPGQVLIHPNGKPDKLMPVSIQTYRGIYQKHGWVIASEKKST